MSPVKPELVVEEEKYQTEQETVPIVLATCPRCGSTERTPLKEITPRIYTNRGCVIRYRTQCLGRIYPVGKDGMPVVDENGEPVSYECGNRYKAKTLVPNAGKTASRLCSLSQKAFIWYITGVLFSRVQ